MQQTDIQALFSAHDLDKGQLAALDLSHLKTALLQYLSSADSGQSLLAARFMAMVRTGHKELWLQLKGDTALIQAGLANLSKGSLASQDKEYLSTQISVLASSEVACLGQSSVVTSLMDSLEDLPDEPAFRSMISLLVELLLSHPGGDLGTNPLCQTLLSHPNNRYFKEYLIHLLNLGDEGQKEKTMLFVKLVFTSGLNEFFYSNDLKIVFDVQLQEIQNVLSETKRNLSLTLLLLIVRDKQYEVMEYHRKDELNSVLDDLLYNEISTLNQEVISQIQKITL